MVNFNLARWQNFVLTLGVMFFMSSCDKDENYDNATNSVGKGELIALTFKNPADSENFRIKTGLTGACAVQTQELLIGQKSGLGEVSIYKAGPKLYVTLSINDNNDPRFIAKSTLFVGKIDDLGVKKNPAPGKFPISAEIEPNINGGVKEHTYELNLGDYQLGTLDFALHADVVVVNTNPDGSIMYNSDGYATVKTTEGAWGKGIKFNEDGKGSWAEYMAYNTNQSCASCDPIFTSVSGGLTRSQGALNVDYEISYPFFNNGEIVGSIDLTYTPSGNVNIKYTVTKSGISIKEVAAKVSYSLVNTDFSAVSKTIVNDTYAELEFKGFDGNSTIYAAFYADLNGICL